MSKKRSHKKCERARTYSGMVFGERSYFRGIRFVQIAANLNEHLLIKKFDAIAVLTLRAKPGL